MIKHWSNKRWLYRKILKVEGMTTRDPRVKERKNTDLKARKDHNLVEIIW